MKTVFKYCHFNPIPYETHMQVFKLIKGKEKILDVGCSIGYFAERLNKKGCIVTGIEINPKAAEMATKFCKKVLVGDIRNISSFPLSKSSFDVILMLDVLEHLKDPEITLSLLRHYLRKNGRLIISTPNIAHISIRINLLLGKFEYQELGIMDKSHVHFFTRESLICAIKKAKFKISKIDYSADFGQLPFLGMALRRIPKRIQYPITKLFRNLLAVQIIAVCQK